MVAEGGGPGSGSQSFKDGLPRLSQISHVVAAQSLTCVRVSSRNLKKALCPEVGAGTGSVLWCANPVSICFPFHTAATHPVLIPLSCNQIQPDYQLGPNFLTDGFSLWGILPNNLRISLFLNFATKNISKLPPSSSPKGKRTYSLEHKILH